MPGERTCAEAHQRAVRRRAIASGFARVVAMLSAILTLICVGAWVVDGAPAIVSLDLFDKATDIDFAHHRFSIGNWMLWAISARLHWAGYGQLIIIVVTVTAAALLSLLTLLRGGQTLAVRYLGTGLGWWALSMVYFYVVTLVPTFNAFESIKLYIRIACDVIAFQLLLASCYAFIRFWRSFPRPVSDEELGRFVEKLTDKQFQVFASIRRVTRRLWSFGRAPVAKPIRMPQAVWVVLVIAAVFVSSLGWRIGVFKDDPLLLAALVCYIVLFYAPGFQCTRLFRFHRTLGSDEDKRKIEWIWAALWIGIVLMLLPAVILPIWRLAQYWLPELPDPYYVATLYLIFAITSGPLILIAALAMSIFYRGSLDPKLALRGFTIWTLLGVVLTLVFVLIERSIALRLAGLLKLPPQTSFVAAGAMVAVTFQPIRKYVEKHVNRFVERVLPTTLLASGDRHTVVVAVVDISGYSALSIQDEQSALLASTLVQKEARRLADRYGGRVVKTTGDGAILCFKDAKHAVDAVVALHGATKAGAATLNLPRIDLHSGLHWGEVVEMHDGDIYGQTVNLAARIADWAKAGEIGASETFCAQLPGGLGGFEVSGPQSFKNVAEPVRCLKLAPS